MKWKKIRNNELHEAEIEDNGGNLNGMNGEREYFFSDFSFLLFFMIL